ncbi:MAG: sulfate adenylyltransferase, partial [Candidatus Eremiobacteraeota bacterium]|nr:sulfate adenylyltransferase [Candidatus Eremiobacteraeota bacterium]
MPAKHLNPPHGGTLIDRVIPSDKREAALRAAEALPRLDVSDRSLCDVVCIGTGIYSPLQGFMGSADYRSILTSMRLASGLLWSIPITLPVPEGLKAGSTVA